MESARTLRQVLLVGEEGQTAIERATAACDGPTLAHTVARLYAERAGFAAVVPGPVVSSDAAPELESPACQQVLQGARAAMRAIRDALRSES